MSFLSQHQIPFPERACAGLGSLGRLTFPNPAGRDKTVSLFSPPGMEAMSEHVSLGIWRRVTGATITCQQQTWTDNLFFRKLPGFPVAVQQGENKKKKERRRERKVA